MMHRLFPALAFLLVVLNLGATPEKLLQANELHADQAYVKALELYQQVDPAPLTAAEQDFLRFRLADCKWRIAAAQDRRDDTDLQEAREDLRTLADDLAKEQPVPELWAFVQESLGQSFYAENQWRYWQEGWPQTQKALDYWAESTKLDRARERYLGMLKPLIASENYRYYQRNVPEEYLENGLKVAQLVADKALFHWALANHNQSGAPAAQQRRAEDLRAIIELGPQTEFYDDALYQMGLWESSYGRSEIDEDGEMVLWPDYEAALEWFRRLTKEFSAGQSQWVDDAQNRIQLIQEKQVQVLVSHAFRPGTEVQFDLHWRNIDAITLEVFPVNITAHKPDVEHRNLAQTDLSGIEPLRTLKFDKQPQHRYYDIREEVRLEGELPLGAYVVKATGGEQTARALLLVSDAALVIKTASGKALAWYVDALTGEPIPDAEVVLYRQFNENRTTRFETKKATTGKDGVAVFEIEAGTWSHGLFAARKGQRQSFARTTLWGTERNSQNVEHNAYIYADRPAYKPGETVHWKAIVRRQTAQGYQMPETEEASYDILSPRGEVVAEGVVKLNDFGSCWGDLELQKEWPLGVYWLQLHIGNERVAETELFRLEEYKLPEFKVTVETGKEGGQALYLLGDTVEGTVKVDYYFGGSVPNAEVELVVTESPFEPIWYPWREYDWLRTSRDYSSHYYGGERKEILREAVTTGANGNASFSFQTPRSAFQDYVYTVEARVTDASRREIVAQKEIKVTRQSYYAYIEAGRRIYEPGERSEFTILTLDANHQPVTATGNVRLTRERWREIWIDRHGRELTGEQIRKLENSRGGWFNFGPDPSEFRLQEEGYVSEEITSTRLETASDGTAIFTFTPEEPGYYKLTWLSRGKRGQAIRAEEAIWVSKEGAQDLGYRPGKLQIVVDDSAFEVGQRAPVMLSTPVSGRYVLFTVGADSFEEWRVIHVEGTSKLLYLDLTEAYVPNTFVEANMVADESLWGDKAEIVVPPTRKFLDLSITPDREGYEPQDEATWKLRATDNVGNPVQAELSFALFDEAVLYIQNDLAEDMRKFYYGRTRYNGIITSSSLQSLPFYRPLEEVEKEAEEAREKRLGMEEEVITLPVFGVRDSSIGYRSTIAEGATRVPPASPPPSLAQQEVAANTSPEQPRTRTDFRSTVTWVPAVVTDANGEATVSFTFPDSLTSWQAVTRGITKGTEVGTATASTTTRLPLIARLQAPRFFTVGDEVIVSGVFNNNTEESVTLDAQLDIGPELEQLRRETEGPLNVPAGGDLRVDWRVKATTPGEVRIALTGTAGSEDDAMEKTYPVFAHGIDKLQSTGGKITGAGGVEVTLDVPEARSETEFWISLTPSVAATMLDALPYLIDYPYGCVEQTLSRFMPAAIVSKTLRDNGFEPNDIAGRMFGGIEKQFLDETHSGDNPGLEALDEVVAESLQRLYNAQRSDGGWGWWTDSPRSDHYMTAYALWGLTVAKQAGLQIDDGRLARAQEFLSKSLIEEEWNPSMQAWMLHALSTRASDVNDGRPSRFEARAMANLIKARAELDPYSLSLVALSAANYGLEDDGRLLLENLRNAVIRDKSPENSVLLPGSQGNAATLGTAHWGETGVYWHWRESAVESTAFALRAFLRLAPNDELVEPTLNWLVKNRRGAQWTNTKDSSIAVLALNDYLVLTGELENDLGYRVTVNGETVAEQTISAEEILTAPAKISVDSALVQAQNTIRIERTTGKGSLYFNVACAYFSEEEPISAAGSEIFVKREYYKLTPVPTLLGGYKSEKTRLKDGDAIESGDRIEVVLTLEGKNDSEYLLLEDFKPAGFESVRVRSGEPIYAHELKDGVAETPEAFGIDDKERYTGSQVWLYQELRDRLVANFADKLPQGYWEVRYELRAETPGHFHALPAMVHAMYVPEIRANSNELRVSVEDEKGEE